MGGVDTMEDTIAIIMAGEVVVNMVNDIMSISQNIDIIQGQKGPKITRLFYTLCCDTSGSYSRLF